MTQPPHDEPTAAGPEELREQVEQTRSELGETIEALAAKADVKARVKDKAAQVRQQTEVKAAEAKDQAAAKADVVRAKAADVAHQVQDTLPDPVRHQAARGARTARDHRTALLVAATTGALVLWLVSRRGRGGRS
ncbi:DUF3618 domain-containing protein [Streptomyces sp. NPDC041068]|uniref:DUF3618 domain-containing protein n=1 Tax=Streptomyces sp. NPDC041068 TaxID=3155130 RepID=UPI0033E0A63D